MLSSDNNAIIHLLAVACGLISIMIEMSAEIVLPAFVLLEFIMIFAGIVTSLIFVSKMCATLLFLRKCVQWRRIGCFSL